MARTKVENAQHIAQVLLRSDTPVPRTAFANENAVAPTHRIRLVLTTFEERGLIHITRKGKGEGQHGYIYLFQAKEEARELLEDIATSDEAAYLFLVGPRSEEGPHSFSEEAADQLLAVSEKILAGKEGVILAPVEGLVEEAPAEDVVPVAEVPSDGIPDWFHTLFAVLQANNEKIATLSTNQNRMRELLISVSRLVDEVQTSSKAGIQELLPRLLIAHEELALSLGAADTARDVAERMDQLETTSKALERDLPRVEALVKKVESFDFVGLKEAARKIEGALRADAGVTSKAMKELREEMEELRKETRNLRVEAGRMMQDLHRVEHNMGIISLALVDDLPVAHVSTNILAGAANRKGG
jgi:predicted transcriptional regulator